MNSTRVLALLALFLGLAHSFSWDIVMGETKRLAFYFNGTLTHTEEIPLASFITSLTYDPVHDRLLFSDHNRSSKSKSISSFDLSTTKIQPIVTREADGYYMILAYDPVTQLLFWKEGWKIYSCSLKPVSSNEAAVVHLFRKLEVYCRDLAVDSCGGYIYWATDYEIVRARFDGSETEALIQEDVVNRGSIAIDHQTQKIYWGEKITKNDGYLSSIESADFNGNNRRTIYTIKNRSYANSLAISKDFIYWNDAIQQNVWQLPKNLKNNDEAKLLQIPYRNSLDSEIIAANYSIQEQTQGIPNCEALKSLTQNNSKTELPEVSLLCVHGTKVSGESRCECEPGYTGERCDVSLCYNYCLQGYCNVSAEGHPKCSCNRGYSGERCEVNACHKHCFNDGVCSLNEVEKPVCQCTADYQGERCDVSLCKDYCLQGNCSISTEGHPTCSCNHGYSGERCDYSICKDYCFEGNCSVSTEGQPNCSCNRGYSGERCEVNACHKHCFNDGVCSLNEAEKPVCQCTADYQGERCDVSLCKDYCLQGNCSISTEGQRTCSCDVGYSGERCEVNACHSYCLNNGECSLNEEDEPFCQCTQDYEGERCDVATTVIDVCICADKSMTNLNITIPAQQSESSY